MTASRFTSGGRRNSNLKHRILKRLKVYALKSQLLQKCNSWNLDKILQISKKFILLQSQRGIRRRDDNPYRSSGFEPQV